MPDPAEARSCPPDAPGINMGPTLRGAIPGPQNHVDGWRGTGGVQPRGAGSGSGSWQHRARAIGTVCTSSPRGGRTFFPSASLQFPEAADGAIGRGAGSPGSTPAASPAHRSPCPTQADPPACHPRSFACPCHAGAPPAPRSGLRPQRGPRATGAKSRVCATTLARDGDLSTLRAPFPRQKAALATGTGWGGPRRSQCLLSLRLTPGLRNVGSPPARLPREAAACGGVRGHPLSAPLFIFSVFVEGNESRGERGAKDGPGGLADGASAEGQQVREASQRFPTTPNGPCHPARTLLSPHLLPQPFWIRSAAVGLLSCALPLPPARPSADAAGHAGANRCLRKKPLQGEWARSRREQAFSSFQ